MYISNNPPQYTLINSSLTAPNTNGITCNSSNVEIQVNCFFFKVIVTLTVLK